MPVHVISLRQSVQINRVGMILTCSNGLVSILQRGSGITDRRIGTGGIGPGKIVLRAGVTLIGRSAVPVHRLCAVFRQTLSSAVVYGTEVGLGARVPKVGGLTIGVGGGGALIVMVALAVEGVPPAALAVNV